MDPINCWESPRHKAPLIYSLDCWKLSHLRLCLLPWGLCPVPGGPGLQIPDLFPSSGQYLRVSFKTTPGVSLGFCWYFIIAILPLGLPRWFSGKEPACQCRRHKRCGFNPWVRKIPWSRRWQPTPVSLPGESHGQRSLAGYSPRDRKELDRTELLNTDTHTHTHTHLLNSPFVQSCFFPLPSITYWS